MIVRLALSCVLLLMSLTLVKASGDEVRKSLFDEDFRAARELLENLDQDGAQKAEFERVINECQLAWACDKAWAHIEAGELSQAKTLLEQVQRELPTNLSSQARALGLLALSQVGEGEPTEQDLHFVENLDLALEQSREHKQAHEEKVSGLFIRIDATFVEALASLAEGKKQADLLANSVALKEFNTVRAKCDQASQLLKLLEPLIEPEDHAGHVLRIEQEAEGLLIDIAEGLGSLYFETREFQKAARAVEEGLLLDPNHADLLDLRIQIEELWKLKIFMGREVEE